MRLGLLSGSEVVARGLGLLPRGPSRRLGISGVVAARWVGAFGRVFGGRGIRGRTSGWFGVGAFRGHGGFARLSGGVGFGDGCHHFYRCLGFGLGLGLVILTVVFCGCESRVCDWMRRVYRLGRRWSDLHCGSCVSCSSLLCGLRKGLLLYAF